MSDSARGPLRLLLDTNVVVAGLLWRGPPRRLIDLAIEGDAIELFSSEEGDVGRPQIPPGPPFAKGGGKARHSLVAHYAALVSLVNPTSVPSIVFTDADDDHVIAAGVAARAELIVTGDRKHLLPIGTHQGIAIVTAREALDRLEAALRH